MISHRTICIYVWNLILITSQSTHWPSRSMDRMAIRFTHHALLFLLHLKLSDAGARARADIKILLPYILIPKVEINLFTAWLDSQNTMNSF